MAKKKANGDGKDDERIIIPARKAPAKEKASPAPEPPADGKEPAAPKDPPPAKKKAEEGSRLPRWKIAFGAAWALVMVVLFLANAFQVLQWRWQDVLYRTRGIVEPRLQAFIVKIDDPSIEEIGQYPWPRRVYAQLIDKMAELGVKTIAFDVLFLEKSPSPMDDRLFFDAVKRSNRVVSAVRTEWKGIEHVNQWPVGGLKTNSALHGYVNVAPDPDQHIRRVITRLDTADGVLPVLGLAALSHFQGRPVEQLYQEVPEQVVINLLGERPDKELGQGITQKVPPAIRYVFHSISAIDIIKGRLSDEDKAVMKGGLAFIGSTATGAFDHYASAFAGVQGMPGVLVHMTLADNVVSGAAFDFLIPLVIVLVIVALTALPFYFAGLSPLVGALATLGVVAGWSLLTFVAFKASFIIEWAAPVAAHASTFVILMVHRTLTEQKEKRWIKNTFGQYLSPKVVDILVNDPEKLTLGGEKRDLTVFFLDIAHFTSISEKMDPEKLTQFLNQYLSALTEVILRNDGVVDKYIGDCIMAFWNAPVDQPRHRLLACLSAVECIETIERLNDTVLPAEVPERPAIRVGLNSGYAVVGNMGSNLRFSYTVIGDEVNLASRLEGANKFFGSSIMASEATFRGEAEKELEARPLGRVKVVGKDVPIMVYELLGRRGKLPPAKAKMLAAYLEGLDHYLARRFDKAQASFEEALKHAPGDAPTSLYLRTCQDFSIVPPPKDWDGVWALTSK